MERPACCLIRQQSPAASLTGLRSLNIEVPWANWKDRSPAVSGWIAKTICIRLGMRFTTRRITSVSGYLSTISLAKITRWITFYIPLFSSGPAWLSTSGRTSTRQDVTLIEPCRRRRFSESLHSKVNRRWS